MAANVFEVSKELKVGNSYRCFSTHPEFGPIVFMAESQVNSVDNSNQVLYFTDFSMHPVKKADRL